MTMFEFDGTLLKIMFTPAMLSRNQYLNGPSIGGTSASSSPRARTSSPWTTTIDELVVSTTFVYVLDYVLLYSTTRVGLYTIVD